MEGPQADPQEVFYLVQPEFQFQFFSGDSSLGYASFDIQVLFGECTRCEMLPPITL